MAAWLQGARTEPDGSNETCPAPSDYSRSVLAHSLRASVFLNARPSCTRSPASPASGVRACSWMICSYTICTLPPQIQIAVHDADMMGRDLVGQFFIDCMTVYYEPDHELWRTWVTLQAPHSARRHLFSKDAHGGVQGYLRLSITLLGPDDTPKIHQDDEEEDEGGEGEGGGGGGGGGGSSILLPPTMRRHLVYLRVDVLCASHLPRMDSTGTAGIGKRPVANAPVRPKCETRL